MVKKFDKLQISGQNKVIHTQHENMYDRANGIEDQENDYAQFYSPLKEDDQYNYQPRGFKGKALTTQPNMYAKKKSINLNSNNDFTGVGISHMSTKYVPKTMKKI